MDGGADNEKLAVGFGTHYGSGGRGGESLQIEAVDWIFDAAYLVGFCLVRREACGGECCGERRKTEQEGQHCEWSFGWEARKEDGRRFGVEGNRLRDVQTL